MNDLAEKIGYKYRVNFAQQWNALFIGMLTGRQETWVYEIPFEVLYKMQAFHE